MDKLKQVFSNNSDKDHHSHSTHSGTTATRDSTMTGNNSTRNPLTSSTGNTTGTTTGSSIPGQHTERSSQGEHIREHAAPPAHAHPHSKDHTHLDQNDAAHASHDHKHLAAVTHEKHHVHETEEVERQREVDRHVHHVQHHVQPVLDTQHSEHQHHERVHPVTKVEEKHVNTEEDKALFAGLAKHKDEFVDAGKERTVIDKGETVHENTSHHVHHVVQPVIERDTHEHHTVHTVIPTHQTTHEAPIVHQSVEHEPMHIGDFVKGGGDLKSKLTHHQAGVLSEGECERSIDGPLEKLTNKLHLGESHSTTGATGSTGSTGTTGMTGNSGINTTTGTAGTHTGSTAPRV